MRLQPCSFIKGGLCHHTVKVASAGGLGSERGPANMWQPPNPVLLLLPPQPQQSALRPPHDNPSSGIWDLRLFGSQHSTHLLNGHISAACLDREGEGSGVEELRPGSCAPPLTPSCLHIASAWHVHPVFTQTLPILHSPSHGAPFSFSDFTLIH